VSPRTPGWPDEVLCFLEREGLREHPSLAALRQETDRLAEASMRSSAEQMQLIAFLLQLMGASRVLEIGCFTGYGTLAMALALPPHGRVITLDVNSHWAEIGRPFWRAAGVAERIAFLPGEASASSRRLLATGAAGSFDFVYIDADKKRYPDYFELTLQLVRDGGIIAADNMLWGGAVADPANTSRQVVALRRLFERIRGDPSLSFCTLPIGDGLLLARRQLSSGASPKE
jgi:predicted O-methyltransferase YrrM